MPGPILCAPPYGGDPFSRSYGVSLPSSLTVNHSSALVYSTRPPVSVYGTGLLRIYTSGFSWKCVSGRYRLARGLAVLSPLATPTGFAWPGYSYLGSTHYSVSARAFHCSVSTSLRKRVTEFLPFVHRDRHTLTLRPRLTLIRLALIRNPWSYGGRVSRPPCRYLFLHLLFPPLQQDSRLTFGATGMLPYQL